MARAAGFDKPYYLTDDQLATVKGYLEKLKPNVLQVRRSRPPTASTRWSAGRPG